MNMVIRLLEQYGYISPLCKEGLLSHITTQTVEKGEILLEKGELSSNFYVLESGLVRGFYEQNNHEFDTWYAFDHSLLFSTYQLYKSKASLESVQCIESCVIHAIPNQVLFQFCTEYPELNIVLRRATEENFLKLQERIWEMRTLLPQERYCRLSRKLHYDIVRIPIVNIASYLGVTVELARQWMQK